MPPLIEKVMPCAWRCKSPVSVAQRAVMPNRSPTSGHEVPPAYDLGHWVHLLKQNGAMRRPARQPMMCWQRCAAVVAETRARRALAWRSFPHPVAFPHARHWPRLYSVIAGRFA